MQENLKKEKRSNAFYIVTLCVLLLLFTASLFLAVIAPVFTSHVAFADSPAVEVTDLQSQASSDYTLQNIQSYTKLYGAFFNKSFTMSYEDCVAKDSYFQTFGADGIVITIKSIASDNFYSRSFVFSPSKLTNDFISQLEAPFTLTAPVYALYCSVSKNSNDFGTGFCKLIYNDVADYNNLINWEMYSDLFLFKNSVFTLFDFASIEKSDDTTITYTDFVPVVSGMSADMLDFWSDFLYLSLPSIGGSSTIIGVPQEEYDSLKSQYDDLLSSMDFSTFNSVDLNSTKPLIQSTTMGNAIGSSAATATYNGVNYGGYWYFRNSVEKSPNSLGLSEFDIGSTLLAGSDIKISYDALFPYNGTFADNVGIVLSFSNYGVYSTASNLKGQYVFIPASDFIGKEFIFNFDFDVNYIAFGVGTFDSSSNTYGDITLGYDINSSIKQGVFISNFVVKGRGSNFSVAIDNANKQGYNKGYQEGKVAGETIGYQQGVKDQGDYTFMGLIGAVFDAPVQAFKGLLSFEVLGVDMTAFVSSLFALAVIVVIIKIALGGK